MNGAVALSLILVIAAYTSCSPESDRLKPEDAGQEDGYRAITYPNSREGNCTDRQLEALLSPGRPVGAVLSVNDNGAYIVGLQDVAGLRLHDVLLVYTQIAQRGESHVNYWGA